jgi:hypothetical protein
MKTLFNLLEIATIIGWAMAIIITIGGGNIRIIVGITCMVAGLWVIVAGVCTYKNFKDEKRNQKT